MPLLCRHSTIHQCGTRDRYLRKEGGEGGEEREERRERIGGEGEKGERGEGEGPIMC